MSDASTRSREPTLGDCVAQRDRDIYSSFGTKRANVSLCLSLGGRRRHDALQPRRPALAQHGLADAAHERDPASNETRSREVRFKFLESGRDEPRDEDYLGCSKAPSQSRALSEPLSIVTKHRRDCGNSRYKLQDPKHESILPVGAGEIGRKYARAVETTAGSWWRFGIPILNLKRGGDG